MAISIAEERADHHQASIVMTHIELIGNADSTVHLHGFGSDAPGSTTREGTRAADDSVTPRLSPVERLLGRQAQCTNLLLKHVHLHHPMLQSLVGANDLAELFANLEILAGGRVECRDGTERLTAKCDGCLV